MALRSLSPPPVKINIVLPNGQLHPTWGEWLDLIWRKTGKASDTAPINVAGDAGNITGVLSSAHAAPNLGFNSTNDATADSVDVDAGSCKIRVYGPGGVGTDWRRYESGRTLGPFPATEILGLAYATTYYVAYNPNSSSYVYSASYKDVVSDELYWVAEVLPNASFGGAGATSGGGGAVYPGATGGGGYGRLR